jgi:aromatic ring hydroxylase
LGLEYYQLEEDMTTSTLLNYIVSSSAGLYDHKDAPKQEPNIIINHPDTAKELHQFLIRYMKATS